MHDILIILHLIGLMLGAAGGIASMLVMRRALAAAPEQAMTLRSLGPLFARVSLAGLVLMWVTGVSMVALAGGVDSLPAMFWVKIGFVLTLTAAAFAIEFVYADIKRGNAKAAAFLPRIGPIAGISSVLAVIFAVLAFH